MKKYLGTIVILSLFLLGCEDNFTEDQEVINNRKIKEVVLKERDPNNPWIPSDYESIFSSKKTKASIGIPQVKYLGMSYKNTYYPIQDARNLGNQVIDYENLQNNHPSYFKSWKVNGGEATSFSYATFDRYTSNSTITKEVNGGFKLNLGLFSIGNRKNTKSVFTENITENKDVVFGELNVIVKDSAFSLQISSNILDNIKANYLLKEFKDELYNTHPSEFFSNYGGVVLADFVTGGKATALYAGIYKKTETVTTKEKNMNREIDSSFTFDYKDKSDGSVSGDLKLGNNNSNTTSVTNEFSSVMMAVRTLGGSGEFATFSTPSEVKNTTISLSGWLTSLNNKANTSIIEFNEGGLRLITDFIPEFNLRQQIKNYLAAGVSSVKTLQEPYLKIYHDYENNTTLRRVKVILYTRFGDEFTLKHDLIPPIAADNYVIQEINRYQSMFGLKIVGNSITYTNNSLSSEISGLDKRVIFDENLLKKCTHNGTVYLVSDYIPTGDTNDEDNFSGGYYAFSIHKEKLLDEYAMRTLVDRLPTTNINFETLLKKYRIIAL